MVASRKPVEPRRVGARDGALTGVMVDPVALFERSFEVADAYEQWLEAQAELFWALHVYSTASLGLFRSLVGKQPDAHGEAPSGDRHAVSGHRKQRRMR